MRSISEDRLLAKRVETRLLALRVRRGDGILVGCSGGPDSTALLVLLASLRSWSLRLVACYVDHGLRERSEIDAEIAFVGELGRGRGVPVVVDALAPGEVLAQAGRDRGGIEEAARRLRYARLHAECDRYGLNWIAVGHTIDDQAETLLMRLFQGAGPAGLRGIPPSRGKIIRPLLGTTHARLVAYLQRRGMGYRIDSSNHEETFLRNRVRNELLPPVQRLFPGYLKALMHFAATMRAIDGSVEQASLSLRWEPAEGGIRISLARFQRAEAAARTRSILRELNRMGIGGRIPAGFLSGVVGERSAIESPGRERRVLARGHGICIERQGDWLWLRRGTVVHADKKRYLIEVYGDMSVTVDGRLTITISIKRAGELSADEVGIEPDPDVGPIVVRSRRAGDRVHLAGGTVSLKELFTQWRLPPRIRELVPVVEDRLGIAAVLGKGLGRENRFAARSSGGRGRTDSAKVVAIEVHASGEYLEQSK